MPKRLLNEIESETIRLNQRIGLLILSLTKYYKDHSKEPVAQQIVDKYRDVEQRLLDIKEDLKKL